MSGPLRRANLLASHVSSSIADAAVDGSLGNVRKFSDQSATSWIPAHFVIPEVHVVPGSFSIEALRVSHSADDYEAVMGSQKDLFQQFERDIDCHGPWFSDGWTLERHTQEIEIWENEHNKRIAFNYSIMAPDHSRILGALHIEPPTRKGFDSEVRWWTVSHNIETGAKLTLDRQVEENVREWLASTWPLSKIAFPGRDQGWDEYEELPELDPAWPRLVPDYSSQD